MAFLEIPHITEREAEALDAENTGTWDDRMAVIAGRFKDARIARKDQRASYVMAVVDRLIRRTIRGN